MQLQGKEHRARATQGGQSPTLESQQSRLEFSRLNLSFGQLTVFNFMKSSIKILFKIWFPKKFDLYILNNLLTSLASCF